MEEAINFLKGKVFESEEVKEYLKNHKSRIVSRDGKPYMVTADFNPKRLNLSLNKGIITNIGLG